MLKQLIAVLHLEDVDRVHVNLKTGKSGPLDVYLKNALTLYHSLQAQGWSLLVVSDRPDVLTKRMAELGIGPDRPQVQAFAFTLDAPKGIRFRGSHFRFDVIAAISQGVFGPQAGIVDVDVVALNSLAALETVAPNTLVVPQVEVGMVGVTPGLTARIADEIAQLGGTRPGRPIWYGGEFIYGHAAAYAELAAKIRAAWPAYRDHVDSFHYVGSEMILTAAFCGLQHTAVVDSAAAGILSRWWSRRTVNAPQPLAVASRSSLLHLPNDKEFLARFSDAPFDAAAFLAAYERRVRLKIMGAHISNLTARFNNDVRKFVPQLA